MTENKRIVLNVVATYGRSLYALVIGLFCGRWTLMALGEVDYGLMGVVGGLMAFVAFLNNLMAQAVSRFYAFSVGQAQVAATPEDGVEECRRWFSIALMMHAVLPVVLIVVGYPVGAWAVRHFLTIPPDRVSACLWVWRFACLSGFVAMVNVPFAAMYNAKQEIAELTIYSFVTTTLNALFLWHMVTHPGVWLAKFALWTCALSVVPQAVIAVRAVVKYRECRFRFAYVWDRGRISQVLLFAGSRALNALASLASSNGMMIVVNKYLGPAKNAAMSIGNTISSHAASLSSSLSGAFQPAITNAAGAGDYDRMRHLIFCTCRFSTAAVMIFALPLMLEINEVTRLWLKHPPEGVTIIALFMLLNLMLSRISEGHWIGIFSSGRIFWFQFVESLLFFARLVLSWVLVAYGWGLWAIGASYVFTGIFSVLTKLIFGQIICGISIRRWITTVLLPLCLAGCLAFLAGGTVLAVFPPSIGRILVTVIVCEIVLLPLFWYLVFAESERATICAKIMSVSAKLRVK